MCNISIMKGTNINIYTIWTSILFRILLIVAHIIALCLLLHLEYQNNECGNPIALKIKYNIDLLQHSFLNYGNIVYPIDNKSFCINAKI